MDAFLTSPDARAALITPREVAHFLRRNLLLFVPALAVALAAAAAYLAIARPIYRSAVTIRIDLSDRTGVHNEFELPSAVTNDNALYTEMEELGGDALATEVIDSLGLQAQLAAPRHLVRSDVVQAVSGLDRELQEPLDVEVRRTSGGGLALRDRDGRVVASAPTETTPLHLGGLTLRLRPSAVEAGVRLVIVPLHDAIADFQKTTTITRPKYEANVIAIEHLDADPRLTPEVPNVMAATFLARRVDVRRAQARATAAFLRQQLDTLSHQLTRSEDTLRAFRESTRSINLPAEATTAVTRVAQLESQRQDLEAERSALAALVAEVESNPASAAGDARPSAAYRRLLAFPTLLRNQAASEMLRSLSDADAQRSALLTRRLPSDPEVQVLSERVSDIELQLRSVATTYLQGLERQLASLNTSLASLRADAGRIPAQETEYARLERRPKTLGEMFSSLQLRLKEAEITAAVSDPSVRVLDYASAPTKPVRPRQVLVLVVALVGGSVLGLVLAFAREQSDQSVHTRRELAALVNLPILGQIPSFRADAAPLGAHAAVRSGPRRYVRRGGFLRAGSSGAFRTGSRATAPGGGYGSDPSVVEAYRAVRTNLRFANGSHSRSVLVVTSPLPGDGKSTSALHLAVLLARQGANVALVDGDLRNGTLARVVGAEERPGLAECLAGEATLSEALRPLVGSFDAPSLLFLPRGDVRRLPGGEVDEARLTDVLGALRNACDVIVFDTPPVNLVPDAAIAASMSDGVVLVARAGRTPAPAIRYAAAQLEQTGARVLGVILNDVDVRRDPEIAWAADYGHYYTTL